MSIIIYTTICIMFMVHHIIWLLQRYDKVTDLKVASKSKIMALNSQVRINKSHIIILVFVQVKLQIIIQIHHQH